MATLQDVENCYRYIIGREMNDEEIAGYSSRIDTFDAMAVADLRRSFLRSAEFHHRHLETFFENLVPNSIIVAHDVDLGFRIYLDLRQLHLAFGIMNNAYEREEVEVLRRIVPDDGLFLDVGANVGYFTLAIASRPGFRGQVMSFEPLAPLFDLLQRSVSENNLQDRVTARPVALAEQPGTLPLTQAEHSINAGSTRLAVGSVDGGRAARMVQVETLDRVAADIRPDVIKVDIEGAEGLFFHGGAKTIEQHKPTILFEVNQDLLSLVSRIRAADIHHWLAQLGYRQWAVLPAGLAPIRTGAEIAGLMPASGVVNILAVHGDKVAATRPLLADLAGDGF